MLDEELHAKLRQMLTAGARDAVALLRVEHHIELLLLVHELLNELNRVGLVHVVVGRSMHDEQMATQMEMMQTMMQMMMDRLPAAPAK